MRAHCAAGDTVTLEGNNWTKVADDETDGDDVFDVHTDGNATVSIDDLIKVETDDGGTS